MLVRDKKNPSLLDPFIRFAKNEVFEYAPWSLSNETFGVNLLRTFTKRVSKFTEKTVFQKPRFYSFFDTTLHL